MTVLAAAASLPIDPATLASSAVIAAFVTGIFLLVKAIADKRVAQVASPSDHNEATRLGNEFLSSLLRDAREERKELRDTIASLESDGTTKQSRIDSLNSILEKKDHQIDVLERRAEAAAHKLRLGLPLTLEDLLGPDHRFLAELEAGLEDTAVST